MGKHKNKPDISYTQNRELSWLRFNERVLEEACDRSVPLYERMKFVSIFESNLDEFFMIRVGSLLDLSLMKGKHKDNKSGLTPSEQLKKIYKETVPLCKLKDKTFIEIEKEMKKHEISRLDTADLKGKDRTYIEQYFEDNVLPILSPQIIDYHHPFPHLANKTLNIAVMLQQGEETAFGIIPVPACLPKVVYLPGEGVRYILLEQLILEYTGKVFEKCDIVDKKVITVTRNADISPEDEVFDDDADYRHHMKKVLKKRRRLAAVRLEIQGACKEELLDYLCGMLKIKKEQVFISESPLCMGYVFSLQEKFSLTSLRQLSYPAFEPQPSPSLKKGESVLKHALKQDLLLHYPYEQMDHFLHLIKEAAHDPAVISIKITIYRLANKSKLVEYLTEAAENNKDVTVLMELRARFDEQNNIDWAEEFEEAGCNVLYGFEGFKVHSKICLITRMENNTYQYITQIGTGNYNEKTAKIYTDLSLITSNKEIGLDASSFFKNMAISNLDGQYRRLLVAPTSLKKGLTALIDQEMAKAKEGKPAKIIMKMNSLTDRQLINKLSEASCAGVDIRLIVRGICCLLPGIKNKTENIMVESIVGRFLEHSRIYCFGEGEDMDMYISSADIMTRNTEKRVEIACPILDGKVKQTIQSILEIMLNDNVKGRTLQSDGTYTKRPGADTQAVDSQSIFMREAINHNLAAQVEQEMDPPLKNRLEQWFSRLFGKGAKQDKREGA
ncbi:polyphosphate kinase 1 [Bacillus testis]|uniref:polyphosphate kinase 1 n=1 Tax=Bacillus testis TaxID=1622072 RepID=UPI0009E5FB0A|nr:polyphosphate kinase 1 [Bacillus testis]